MDNQRIDIILTAQQIEDIKNIKVATRYEAMDAVARILNAKTGQRTTWGCTTRKTIIIDNHTTADITFSKGKVKDIQYYDRRRDDCVFYNPLKIQ